MTKLLIFLFPVLLLGNYHLTNEKSLSHKPILVGKWAEKWIGAHTDVNYVDTLQISIVNRQINLITIHRSYIYDNIEFNNRVLKFRMENSSSKDDRFFVYYTLRLNEADDLFQGEIINSKQQTDTVRLEKLPD